MLSFPVPVLSFLFVSFRPSLIRFPQLFLRCFPYALALGIFRFPSAFFRPLQFCLRLLGLCFFLSVLPVSASQWLPRCPASAYAFTVLPVPSSLVSHAFAPGSRTRLSVCFLSSLPASLPQLFHRCFPSVPLPLVCFSSGLFCLPSGSFRPLQFRLRLLSLLLFPFRTSRLRLTVAFPVRASAFASSLSPFSPA